MIFSPQEKVQTIAAWLSDGAHEDIVQWVLPGAHLLISHPWTFTLLSAVCVHRVAASKDVLSTKSGFGCESGPFTNPKGNMYLVHFCL